MNNEFFIGMLSGTSRDGVDAVLVNFKDDTMRILHASCTAYPVAIRQTLAQLLETGQKPGLSARTILDENLGRLFARIAQNLVREAGMEMRDIRAIGSHGQTVWHEPEGTNPVSIQLGKPALICSGTGLTVVADFRSADIRSGGQGAPLAPLLHQRLFNHDKENRAVLNLGGIANLTLLPASGGIHGFDTGPGNCLMDEWTRRHLHKDFDQDGNWASKGRPDTRLLGQLMQEPYFTRPAPKSTGPENFNMNWLEDQLQGLDCTSGDVQTTLAELTAVSVARHLQQDFIPHRLLVCGGGVHNHYLMRRISTALPTVIVENTNRYGVDPDWVEGLLFAWLARERLNGRLQDTSSITGAKQAVLLGDIFEPPGNPGK